MEHVWEFIDSPAPVDWDNKSMQARLVTTYFPDCANLAWARRIDRNDPSKATVSSGQSEVAGAGGDQVYCDWEEPLESLLEHIRTNGPYDGILGFSQVGCRPFRCAGAAPQTSYTPENSRAVGCKYGGTAQCHLRVGCHAMAEVQICSAHL